MDQIKRFNITALTYLGIEAEQKRIGFDQQVNEKLVSLISCLEDCKNEILEYYQEVKDMTDTQIKQVFNKDR